MIAFQLIILISDMSRSPGEPNDLVGNDDEGNTQYIYQASLTLYPRIELDREVECDPHQRRHLG